MDKSLSHAAAGPVDKNAQGITHEKDRLEEARVLHGGFDPLATRVGKRCKREPYLGLELPQEGQGILHRGWITFHKQFFEKGV
jgi:hypothetical protein